MGPCRRLAILSSKEVQESGLSDILTARLGTLPDVELVERDLLGEVMEEVTLSMMLGAEQAQNRRQAGALLKADILVLLLPDKLEDRKTVRFIISDCPHGARLRSGWVLLDKDHIEDTCFELVKAVSETLARFRKGVEQIIGVSYFASNNLVHDYDHLQAGYANLLGNALSTVPGVAVIEIDEARSIRLEEELAGDMNTERVVPLFVEGEFVVHRIRPEEPESVELVVRISDNRGAVEQIKRTGLLMENVSDFIVDDVAEQVLELLKDPNLRILDKEEQFAILAAKASEFADIGAWEQSIALREAAVLLKPDSVEQREELMSEYGRVKKRVLSMKPSFLQIRGFHELVKWKLPFEHLEYIINNELVNMNEALNLSDKCISLLPHDPPWLIPTLGQPTPAEAFKKDFFRTVYSRILELKPSLNNPAVKLQECQKWYGFLLRHIFYRVDGDEGKYHDGEDLDLLFYLHDNVVPDELRPSRAFIRFLKEHVKPGWRRSKQVRGKLGYFTEKDFLDFIGKMSRSRKLLACFYGRFALLYNEYYKRLEKGAPVDDLVDDVTCFLNEVRESKNLDLLAKEAAKLLDKIEGVAQEKRDSEVED